VLGIVFPNAQNKIQNPATRSFQNDSVDSVGAMERKPGIWR
jgi:hypothetical protein